MGRITCTREHEICAGHRVLGHEGKCRHLHGHNYRFELTCEGEDGLDGLGRVIDFSVMKDRICAWLEREWDHKMILWINDPLREAVVQLGQPVSAVPFNPTAENIARHVVEDMGPVLLAGTRVRLVRCVVHETAKCSARYELGAGPDDC